MAEIIPLGSSEAEEFMLLTELVCTGAEISEASQGPLSVPMVEELKELQTQFAAHVADAERYVRGIAP
ncbi:hypothetical protein [Pseudophaeobacter sp. A-200-2]|uniref:hypothetical protein n=1 Tax=Pseudophaeobacter sp. A-200-2 TaxID=3098145 RepID=UPI0034D4ABC3